jgi:hypothetical protein
MGGEKNKTYKFVDIFALELFLNNTELSYW